MILAAAMESIGFYFIIWEISMMVIFAYIPILPLLGLARLCRNNCYQLEIIAAGWLIILAGIIIFFIFLETTTCVMLLCLNLAYSLHQVARWSS